MPRVTSQKVTNKQKKTGKSVVKVSTAGLFGGLCVCLYVCLSVCVSVCMVSDCLDFS